MAIKVQKSDLNDAKYNYFWRAEDAGDNSEIKGGKERLELNRKEGYEMLYFLSNFLTNIEKVSRAEYLIHNKLPIAIRKRSEIEDWLTKNWKMET
jgi:hypothetical protein